MGRCAANKTKTKSPNATVNCKFFNLSHRHLSVRFRKSYFSQVLVATPCEIPAKGIPCNPFVRSATSCFICVGGSQNIRSVFIFKAMADIQPHQFEPMASASPSVVLDLELQR